MPPSWDTSSVIFSGPRTASTVARTVSIVDDADPAEITSPEITALLDLRTWALGTLLQIERIRATWLDLNSFERRRRLEIAGLDEDEDPETSRLYERLQLDVHFLAIAANQMRDARARKVLKPLPRLSDDIALAVTSLRDTREHYLEYRSAYYDDAPNPKALAKARQLRQISADAHPWMIGGSIYAGREAREIRIADVLSVDQLEVETQAVHDAADARLIEIAEQHAAAQSP